MIWGPVFYFAPHLIFINLQAAASDVAQDFHKDISFISWFLCSTLLSIHLFCKLFIKMKLFFLIIWIFFPPLNVSMLFSSLLFRKRLLSTKVSDLLSELMVRFKNHLHRHEFLVFTVITIIISDLIFGHSNINLFSTIAKCLFKLLGRVSLIDDTRYKLNQMLYLTCNWTSNWKSYLEQFYTKKWYLVRIDKNILFSNFFTIFSESVCWCRKE